MKCVARHLGLHSYSFLREIARFPSLLLLPFNLFRPPYPVWEWPTFLREQHAKDRKMFVHIQELRYNPGGAILPKNQSPDWMWLPLNYQEDLSMCTSCPKICPGNSCHCQMAPPWNEGWVRTLPFCIVWGHGHTSKGQICSPRALEIFFM